MTTDAVDGWAALADTTRRVIVGRLAQRPWAVGELAATLPVSRPAVSQHLRLLKAAGLVVDRPVGNRRIYQLDPAGLDAMRRELDGFWSQALDRFQELVERDPTEEP